MSTFPGLASLSAQAALQQDRLGLFGTHVRVRGLLGHKDTADLAQLLRREATIVFVASYAIGICDTIGIYLFIYLFVCV